MSRGQQTRLNIEFITRFIETCGSSRPADIARLLDISYQTSKNYLNGRLPNPDILIRIAERTSYSIDWLLTGRGKKILEIRGFLDTPFPTDQMRAFVREVCVEVINESRSETPKTVVLHSSEIMSEKVLNEAKPLADRQP